MEANQFRIGNIVIKGFKTGCNLIIIDKIGVQDIVRIHEGTGSFSYAPVTLDEKALEKFGLTKPYNDRHGIKRTYPYKMLDGFIKQRNGVYFFKHGTLEVELPYVHTLQNLYFALKKEELKLVDKFPHGR